MTSAFRTAFAGGILAVAATAVALPAVAMPVAVPASHDAIITVSGWATRASGNRHTYAGPYGYGYDDGYARGPYAGWRGQAYAAPYGVYGRDLPPAYGYDGDDGAY